MTGSDPSVTTEGAESLIIGEDEYTSPLIPVSGRILTGKGQWEEVKGDFAFKIPTLRDECAIGAIMARLSSGLNALDALRVVGGGEAQRDINPSYGLAQMIAELKVCTIIYPKWWKEDPAECRDMAMVSAVYDAYLVWVKRFRGDGNKADQGGQ